MLDKKQVSRDINTFFKCMTIPSTSPHQQVLAASRRACEDSHNRKALPGGEYLEGALEKFRMPKVAKPPLPLETTLKAPETFTKNVPNLPKSLQNQTSTTPQGLVRRGLRFPQFWRQAWKNMNKRNQNAPKPCEMIQQKKDQISSTDLATDNDLQFLRYCTMGICMCGDI